jgi:hypothetical protein
MSNPIESVYQDGVAVDKAAVRSLWKQRERIAMGDATEVRNANLSGHFGGMYLRSLDANYKLDTEDVQADDGVNVIIDFAGNHFVKLIVSVGEVDKSVTAAGDVTIADDETADNILINNTSGDAINVYLPDAAARTKRIAVFDAGGNAASHPITILPKSGSSQTIMTGSSFVLDGNGMGITLRPLVSGAGYF